MGANHFVIEVPGGGEDDGVAWTGEGEGGGVECAVRASVSKKGREGKGE